jgi:EmrB/QacA subfamily drug resistance transporter
LKKESWILAVVVIAVIMTALDSSVVLLAFPDITQTLNTNVSSSIWTILVYMIVTVVATTQLGKVGDIYGRGRTFNAGFLVFIVASAICGAAPDIWFLVGFRILQGFGAAMILANSGAIIADTFPKGRLGRPYGYLSSGWGAGNLLGIVVGGFLTTLAGWRYIFYINVPIGIVAFIIGLKFIKSTGTLQRKFDFTGMILLGAGLLLITFDSLSAASQGVSFIDAALIIVGILLLVLFLYKEKKKKNALIDLSVFRKRIVAFSLLAAFFLAIGAFAILFVITLYLQGIVGLSPLNAALLLAPGAVIGLLLSPSMGRLSDKIGFRAVATAGVVFFMLSIIAYLTLNIDNFSPLTVIIASILSGFGTAMFYPSNNAAVMSNSSSRYHGSMNGLLRTLQSTGGLLSYVVVLYISSVVVPRSVAYQVFVGTSHLLGGLTSSFVDGIHIALLGSLVLVIIAGLMSFARGNYSNRKTRRKS